MVSKKYWERSITDFISLVKGENRERNIEILGVSFLVFPGVFSPVYSSDTAWFAEKIVPLIKNKRFLEIGAGTGVISCLAAINGALQVQATDINPEAIENICANAKIHSLNISIKKGCVFDPIDKDELFDIIFWNHPFYCTDKNFSKNEMIALSVYDTEYQSLKKFFQHGKRHLLENGRLILGTSNVARVNLIKRIAVDTGYEVSLLEKVEVPVYRGKKVKMDLRMYEFKVINF